MWKPVSGDSGGAWRAVLKDPEVQRWHGKLGLKSQLTANEYARVLDRYCKAIATTPAAMVTDRKSVV